MDKSFRYSSILLAGGACILSIFGHYLFERYGLLPIRGFRFIIGLYVFPILCVWAGMVFRKWAGNIKWWIQLLIGLLTIFVFYLSRHDVNAPAYFMWDLNYTRVFLIFCGFLLPIDWLKKDADKTGLKSAILCAITGIAYCTIYMVWQRLGNAMRPECTDMETFFLVVTTNVLPIVILPPLWFAIEFSYSKAGQWLGSQKWYFWLSVVAAAICFLGVCARMSHTGPFSYRGNLILMLLVQPVTIYLIVVLYRICRKIRDKETDRDIKSLFMI